MIFVHCVDIVIGYICSLFRIRCTSAQSFQERRRFYVTGL